MNGKKVPLIFGVAMLAVGIWSIFGMKSGFKYLLGPFCLFIGWHSLKTAVYLTDDEVNRLNHGCADQKTQKKFEDL